MWTNKATEIANNWLIQDQSRVHLWNETALGVLQFVNLLGGDGTTRQVAIAQIGNSMRLFVSARADDVGAAEPWAEFITDALRQVCWYEIAQAVLDGAISKVHD